MVRTHTEMSSHVETELGRETSVKNQTEWNLHDHHHNNNTEREPGSSHGRGRCHVIVRCGIKIATEITETAEMLAQGEIERETQVDRGTERVYIQNGILELMIATVSEITETEVTAHLADLRSVITITQRVVMIPVSAWQPHSAGVESKSTTGKAPVLTVTELIGPETETVPSIDKI